MLPSKKSVGKSETLAAKEPVILLVETKPELKGQRILDLHLSG